MIFPFFRQNSAIASLGSFGSRVKCACSTTRSSSASCRNRDFQLRMLLLHLANELNEAVGPIDHFRIVLPIGKLDKPSDTSPLLTEYGLKSKR
jgi:hypothetical protein